MKLNGRIIRRTIFAAALTAAVILLTTMLHAATPTGQKGSAETVSPEDNFNRAHEDYIREDLRAAAEEIREASRYLSREAGELKGRADTKMADSIKELDGLAERVEKGMVTTADEIDQAFSRAHLALASQYQRLSLELRSNNNISEAGKALKSSADHLERAISWSGRKMKDGATNAINKSRDVAQKMISNVGWVAEEVGKALEDVGGEIKSMDEDFKRKGMKK